MNAIILAAGLGTRLGYMTKIIPKCLLKLNDITIVERQIHILKSIGIEEIDIVTGHMASKLEFIKEKYAVNLIYNEKFSEYNSLYSIYLAKNKINDTLILESDIFINKNIIDMNMEKSSYYGIEETNFEDEWIFKVDKEKNISNFYLGSSSKDYILKGISYWNENDGIIIAKKIDEMLNEPNAKLKTWDDVVSKNIKYLDMKFIEVGKDDLIEIDCERDYIAAKQIVS